jgi:hypothetical protein
MEDTTLLFARTERLIRAESLWKVAGVFRTSVSVFTIQVLIAALRHVKILTLVEDTDFIRTRITVLTISSILTAT